MLNGVPQPIDQISTRITWEKVWRPHQRRIPTLLTAWFRTLVHGSLARAGKVKSQTPKVEKQEKKKTPKGRAKKRILYNRRFVILATAFLIFGCPDNIA